MTMHFHHLVVSSSPIFAIGYSNCSDSQEISHIFWNLCSEELSICPYLEPDESSTQLQILFLQNTFQFYPFTDILVDRSDMSNYRCVSLLPSFSKVFEKVLCVRCTNI